MNHNGTLGGGIVDAPDSPTDQILAADDIIDESVEASSPSPTMYPEPPFADLATPRPRVRPLDHTVHRAIPPSGAGVMMGDVEDYEPELGAEALPHFGCSSDAIHPPIVGVRLSWRERLALACLDYAIPIIEGFAADMRRLRFRIERKVEAVGEPFIDANIPMYRPVPRPMRTFGGLGFSHDPWLNYDAGYGDTVIPGLPRGYAEVYPDETNLHLFNVGIFR